MNKRVLSKGMSYKSTSSPSKPSSGINRPISQTYQKTCRNYECNNNQHHYRNSPNNQPFQKHRRSSSFEDHLNNKAHQLPSRSTSLMLPTSSSKQSYTMKEKHIKPNDTVHNIHTFQTHNYPTPNDETIRTFNSCHPYSYDKKIGKE